MTVGELKAELDGYVDQHELVIFIDGDPAFEADVTGLRSIDGDKVEILWK